MYQRWSWMNISPKFGNFVRLIPFLKSPFLRVGKILWVILIFLFIGIIFYWMNGLSSSELDWNGNTVSLKESMSPLENPANPLDFSHLTLKAQKYLMKTEEIRRHFMEKRYNWIGNNKIETFTNGPVTIWNYFPPTFTCPHFVERIGTPGDGGKWVCGMNLFDDRNKSCIIYSFGISGETSFEQEILERTSCTIYAYDPSVSSLPSSMDFFKTKNRINFSKLGLGDRTTSTRNNEMEDQSQYLYSTLGDIMRRNGHDWIDFIKIDIEGFEFKAFQQISKEFPDILPFGHMNLEVHLEKSGTNVIVSSLKALHIDIGSNEDKTFRKFLDMYNAFEKGGLRAFFAEDNHIACILDSRPSLVEYAFVNVKSHRNQLLKF